MRRMIVVALLMMAALANASRSAAQDIASLERGPRFLLASATESKPVRTDPSRVPMLRNRISVRLEDVTLKEALDAMIPAHLEDVLHMLIDRVAQGWKNGTSPVLKYLLHEFGNNPEYARRVKAHLEDELAQGNVGADVSVRVPTYVLLMVDQMAQLAGIANRSEVVRGILASAKKDVLDGRDPELIDAMQRSIAAIA